MAKDRKRKYIKDIPAGLPWWYSKNPHANAGDKGSIPGPGRFHMPKSNWAHGPQPLSLCSRARRAQLPAHTPQGSHSATREAAGNEKPRYCC